MEIIYKKTIELDRSYMFLAIGKDWQNNYCVFTNQYNYLSSFSVWMNKSPERILTDHNPNLNRKTLEDSARYLENKVLETNDIRLKSLYQDANKELSKQFTLQKPI
jgi:hypothetical protein